MEWHSHWRGCAPPCNPRGSWATRHHKHWPRRLEDPPARRVTLLDHGEVLTTLTDAILLETDFATNKRNLIDFVLDLQLWAARTQCARSARRNVRRRREFNLRALYLDAKEGDVILVSKEAEAKALKVKEEAAISRARAKARAQERVEADIQAAAQRSAIKAAEKELDAKRRTLIAQGKPITPLHRTVANPNPRFDAITGAAAAIVDAKDAG